MSKRSRSILRKTRFPQVRGVCIDKSPETILQHEYDQYISISHYFFLKHISIILNQCYSNIVSVLKHPPEVILCQFHHFTCKNYCMKLSMDIHYDKVYKVFWYILFWPVELSGLETWTIELPFPTEQPKLLLRCKIGELCWRMTRHGIHLFALASCSTLSFARIVCFTRTIIEISLFLAAAHRAAQGSCIWGMEGR